MTAAQNKALIAHMWDELSKGNLQAFMDVMSEDIKLTVIGTTRFSGVFRGKTEVFEKVIGALTSQLEGGMSITQGNYIAEGDFVVMESRGEAKTKAGRDYNNVYCQVFRLENGKIIEWTEYLDTEIVTRAFG